MCTAIAFRSRGLYFGRTLDYEHSFGEEVVLTPRRFPLAFRRMPELKDHHAILGMAHVSEGYPLYYDALNDQGLCMAGLNFVGFAQYRNAARDPIAPFEFIPWVLGQCRSVAQARCLLTHTGLTETDFSPRLPAARLHWLIADSREAITVEAMEDGLHVHDNPAGVLTNNPPFPEQLRHLSSFAHLSPLPVQSALPLDLPPISRGTGAMGLPGDLSSPSRFVRAAFTALHADIRQTDPVSQCFHILDTVAQTRGCCRLEDGAMAHTIYTACCDARKGVYYYTTYGNRRVRGIDMGRENLDGTGLIRFEPAAEEDILYQN